MVLLQKSGFWCKIAVCATPAAPAHRPVHDMFCHVATQALAALTEDLGADDPETLTVKNNLATLLTAQGRREEATALLREVGRLLRDGGVYLLYSFRPPFQVLKFLSVPQMEVTYAPVPNPLAAMGRQADESLFLYKCLVRKK